MQSFMVLKIFHCGFIFLNILTRQSVLDTADSDTADSDIAESDTAESDTAESDTTESDIAESDTTESDIAESNKYFAMICCTF